MKQEREKSELIQSLRKEIQSLQHRKEIANAHHSDTELGFIESAFPNAAFPTGVIHEFISGSEEGAAATNGFITGLLGKCLPQNGAYLWVGTGRTIFPPALQLFNIDPGKVIFIDVRKPKDALWVIEESQKCTGVTAVIGEISELSFTESRRLQLAVEQSGVTGLIHRHNPRTENVTACVTRWKINPLASDTASPLPGVGFSRWQVQLVKVRNGKPGSWQVEWTAGHFRHIPRHTFSITETIKRKAG